MEEQSIAMAVFTSIVQGILVAGLSTYINQTVKQIKEGKRIKQKEEPRKEQEKRK